MANVKMLIFTLGMLSKVLIAALSVEPVVSTSSISNRCLPSSSLAPESSKIPSVFSNLSKTDFLVCVVVCFTLFNVLVSCGLSRTALNPLPIHSLWL